MKDAKGHGSDARGGIFNRDSAREFANRIGTSRAPATPPGRPIGGSAVRGQIDQPVATHAAGVDQIGRESSQSRELRLFADNSADLSRQSMQPIRDNLGKKMDKGVYDPAKATKLFGYHADRAAQAYAQEHGDGTPWHKMFTPAVRREAASHWERDERDDIKSGSARTYKG